MNEPIYVLFYMHVFKRPSMLIKVALRGFAWPSYDYGRSVLLQRESNNKTFMTNYSDNKRDRPKFYSLSSAKRLREIDARQVEIEAESDRLQEEKEVLVLKQIELPWSRRDEDKNREADRNDRVYEADRRKQSEIDKKRLSVEKREREDDDAKKKAVAILKAASPDATDEDIDRSIRMALEYSSKRQLIRMSSLFTRDYAMQYAKEDLAKTMARRKEKSE